MFALTLFDSLSNCTTMAFVFAKTLMHAHSMKTRMVCIAMIAMQEIDRAENMGADPHEWHLLKFGTVQIDATSRSGGGCRRARGTTH